METPRHYQGSTEFWFCPFSSDQKNLIAIGERLRLEQLRTVQTTSMQTIQRLSLGRLQKTHGNAEKNERGQRPSLPDPTAIASGSNPSSRIRWVGKVCVERCPKMKVQRERGCKMLLCGSPILPLQGQTRKRSTCVGQGEGRRAGGKFMRRQPFLGGANQAYHLLWNKPS